MRHTACKCARPHGSLHSHAFRIWATPWRMLSSRMTSSGLAPSPLQPRSVRFAASPGSHVLVVAATAWIVAAPLDAATAHGWHPSDRHHMKLQRLGRSQQVCLAQHAPANALPSLRWHAYTLLHAPSATQGSSKRGPAVLFPCCCCLCLLLVGTCAPLLVAVLQAVPSWLWRDA